MTAGRNRPVDGRRPGFTVVELLLVLTVIGTMATMTVPPMLSSQNELRLGAAVQQLTVDLARARSEAVKQNQSVTVTRTSATRYTVPSAGVRELDGQITFSTGSATAITFTSYGALSPVETQTLVLQLAGERRMVQVSAAGFPSVR